MRKLSAKFMTSSCLSKTAYKSLSQAHSVAQYSRERSGQNIQAYHCQICGDYHVGHTRYN